MVLWRELRAAALAESWALREVRLPLDRLLARLKVSDTVAAQMLRTNRTALYEARTRGLSWPQADLWAVRAGLHPALVWPEFYDLRVAS